jgi:hypothetical protein
MAALQLPFQIEMVSSQTRKVSLGASVMEVAS